MTILVTGAAGFIGSNFVKYLNNHRITDIIVSDYLTNGKQFTNLAAVKYTQFVTPDRINTGLLKYLKQVFHFGAMSSTTEWNGELVLARNYNYSVDLIEKCITLNIPVSYSSSASVYGNGTGPLNLYAYSKWLVDQLVLDKLAQNNKLKIQGFRYFNVYSLDESEWHKGEQASPYHKFRQQALETGQIRIFENSEKYLRDFVHVDQVCDLQYRMSHHNQSGIFDLGSGEPQSFRQVAESIAAEYNAQIVEIPFPENLRNHYQTYTCADMSWVKNMINTGDN